MAEQMEMFDKPEPKEVEATVIEEFMIVEPGYLNYLERMTEKCIRLENAGVDNWEGYAEAMAQMTTAQEGDDV